MKRLALITLVCSILPVGALATEPGDMIGIWQFAPALSRNVGPMAQARVTSSISLRRERLPWRCGRSYCPSPVYRYLIHSGDVMIVESQRAGAPIMIMAFVRK